MKRKVFSVLISMFMIFNSVVPMMFKSSLSSNAAASFINGIDVSIFQGTIDWNSVAKSNVDFAIIRCATTNISDSTYMADKNFSKNYSGAVSAGINVGSYMYTSAASKSEMKSNIDSMLKTLGNRKFDLPIFLDVEQASRQTALGKSKLTDILLYGCSLIEDAGFKAGVYANYNWLTNYVDPNKIRSAGYEIWMARYPSGSYAVDPSGYDYSNMCLTWQYSSRGKISGISGNVDVDVRYSGKTSSTPSPSGNTYPACASKYTSIVEALNSIGVDSSYSHREKIAAANGITGYSGTAAQNTKMLDLLKAGKLINPDKVKYSVTIHYNTNGGSIASGGDYYAGSNGDIYKTSTKKIVAPSWQDGYKDKNGLYNASTFKLTKTGYKFKGWSLSKSGGKVYDQSDSSVSANDLFPDVKSKNGTVTLYAQWEAYKLTINYNTNGGVVTNGSPAYYADKNGFIYKVGETAMLTSNFNYGKASDFYNGTTFDIYRIGYSFKGWSISKDGGTLLDQDTQYTFDKKFLPDLESKSCSITLYAQWEPLDNVGLYYYENTSQLNYQLGSDLNNIDGLIKSNDPNISSVSVDKNNTYKNENVLSLKVIKSGNAMQTKTSLSGCATSGSYPEDKTVYLSFYAKSSVPDAKVSVRFGYDDQYSEANLSSEWKYYVLKMHKVPVSDAWIHWYFDTEGSYEFSQIMVSDAKPSEGDYISNSDVGTLKTDKTFKRGSKYGELYVPERRGYKFLGWFTSNNSLHSQEITSETTAECNLGVFAHWSLMGDVNDDDKSTIADVVLLQKWLLNPSGTYLQDCRSADLCEDGVIDAFDLCLMKKNLMENSGSAE